MNQLRIRARNRDGTGPGGGKPGRRGGPCGRPGGRSGRPGGRNGGR